MDLLELLKVIFLGIVEGITEWLPISSTGHMILVDEFIKLNITEEFKELFLVVIQLGAILAVVVLFWKKLWPFATKITDEKTQVKCCNVVVKKDIFVLWFKVLVGSIPAAIIGLLFDDWFDAHFYNYAVVSCALIVYGVLFIIVENINKNKVASVGELSQVTYKTAALIGVFQILSLIPGTSRSGSTILGAILIGCSRYVATEFSFFLSIPVMFGASLLKIVKFGFTFTSAELIILAVGMVVAFVVSIIAIKYLLQFIRKNDFKPFGYYRIILGIIVLLYFALV